MGHFVRECRAPRSQERGRKESYRQWSKAKENSSKALMAIDGMGWDWSYMANEEDYALVADGKAPTEDATIKGRSNNEGEAAAERISNDSEEIARVLTSMDAATVLAGGIDVPTGSGFIPIAGPPITVISTGSEVSPTASPIVTRRKGKEVMVESDTLKKKKLQEQIDAQVARELEGQQEKEDMRMNEQIARDAESQQRRPMTKKQKREYYMAVIKSNLGWRFKDFKGMTFEEIEAKFAEVWKQVEDFIPMGSKEESERLKRKGLNLEKVQVKKQKSSEEAPEIEISTEEFTEEKMKEMMQLVPVEDVYVQALQVKTSSFTGRSIQKGGSESTIGFSEGVP
nr:hypothetical protein [Tanacetum cinerariifolium]